MIRPLGIVGRGCIPTFEKTPSFADCQQLIRERAYELWVESGAPLSDGVSFWLDAEAEVFSKEYGGYGVYVRDDTKPLVDGFYSHWDLKFIKPDGPVDPTWRPTWPS